MIRLVVDAEDIRRCLGASLLNAKVAAKGRNFSRKLDMDMRVKTLGFGLLLLSSLTLTNRAQAQQFCEWRPEGPLGPAWYQPGGLNACNTSKQAVSSPIRWATRWGAIAVDDHTGNVGTIASQSSASEAKRIALERCGSKGCEIVMEYHNQCAAIAWGTKVYNASGAATGDEAAKRALRLCGKDANDCKIVFNECSLPERIQ